MISLHTQNSFMPYSTAGATACACTKRREPQPLKFLFYPAPRRVSSSGRPRIYVPHMSRFMVVRCYGSGTDSKQCMWRYECLFPPTSHLFARCSALSCFQIYVLGLPACQDLVGSNYDRFWNIPLPVTAASTISVRVEVQNQRIAQLYTIQATEDVPSGGAGRT